MEHYKEKLLLTVQEASEMLSMGRTKLLELAYDNVVPSIKIGRSRRFPLDGLKEWIEAESKSQSSSKLGPENTL